MASNRFFDVDVSDFRDAVKELEKLKRLAVPFYQRDAINTSAFAARSIWQSTIGKTFTLRNRYTVRSVRVSKAKGLRISNMEAVVGTTAPYMATQEHGGRTFGSVGMPAVSGETAYPRERLPRRASKLKSISLGERRRKGGRAQRNAANIAMAKDAGKRFVFLETAKSKGIYQLKGSKKNPKISMAWLTSDKTHRIPKEPTLQPTLKQLEPQLDRIHRAAFVRQLKHHRLFGH